MRIAVAGGGVAGLAAALLCARAGHAVVLIDRDPFVVGDVQTACDWDRRGVPHFLLPHAFLPRARLEMLASMPDVYGLLLRAGASELDVARKLRGPRRPEDDDLRYLFVRRPVIEWALRSAATAQAAITVRAGVRIVGLKVRPETIPRVVGLKTSVGDIDADLVIDAQGRTTSVPKWLAQAGGGPRTESAKSFVVYYSRYYRMRPGRCFPDGPWLSMVRGDFGYAGFVTFGGDNGTFATVIASGSWDRDLRILQHEAAYEAVSASVPALHPLTDPDFAEPITPILAMGELQNAFRHYVEDGRARVTGLLAVGDAVAHTDPTFALGLSFAFIHVRALLRAIDTERGTDPEALAVRYWQTIYPEMRERYDLAVETDAARTRAWQGEHLDITHASACYPLFSLTGASIAALDDDDVLRKTARRIGFLDRTSVFDQDTALHSRIEGLLERRQPTRSGPSRDELLRLAREAVLGQA